MFNSYYCNDKQQARPIEELVKTFETTGTEGVNAACSEELSFTSEEWNGKSEKEQQEILMNYRIAYLGDTMVNWCPQLGTVLANDEVSEGRFHTRGISGGTESDASVVSTGIGIRSTFVGRSG